MNLRILFLMVILGGVCGLPRFTTTTDSTIDSTTDSTIESTTASASDIKSAVAVSQLVMAQQAAFFHKLINVTQDTLDCKEMTVEGFGCPHPFTRVVDECFHMSKTGLNWDGAREHCQGMGGDLATPRNLYALKAHILEVKGPKAVWIGGTFYGPERGWKWINGVPVNSEEWSRNQPNNGRKRANCVSMRRDRHPSLRRCFVR